LAFVLALALGAAVDEVLVVEVEAEVVIDDVGAAVLVIEVVAAVPVVVVTGAAEVVRVVVAAVPVDVRRAPVDVAGVSMVTAGAAAGSTFLGGATSAGFDEQPTSARTQTASIPTVVRIGQCSPRVRGAADLE
jgi:hypothetical protein